MAKCSVLRGYGERVHLITTRAVLDEVASPELQRRHPDAVIVARAVEEGIVAVHRVRSRRKLPISLGSGEAAAIRLLLQEGADLLLTDDGRAIRACRIMDVSFTTTPRVVVDLHRAGGIGLADARRALEKLAVVGRYAPEVIAAALVSLNEE